MSLRFLPFLALCALLLAAQQKTRRQGSPLDHLPKNVEVVTDFGERADISPDDQEVAFMNKSFGDAFVVNLKTRRIRCLTCAVPAAAFLRVMHLNNGDYILIGPEKFRDIRTSRHEDNELWYLSRKEGSKPIKLNRKMSEGAALSKKSMKISYSVTGGQDKTLPKGASQLFIAEIVVNGDGTARIANEKMIQQSGSSDCVIEAQDFYANDTKLTYTCYEPESRGSVMSYDIPTGKSANLSQARGTYNEVEGIFPDGIHTCVEADRQSHLYYGDPGGFRQIDIWKLKMDGTGKDFVRLTTFNDYEGWKASNPVVARNGKFMAFQIARTKDEAGVGYGICVQRLIGK